MKNKIIIGSFVIAAAVLALTRDRFPDASIEKKDIVQKNDNLWGEYENEKLGFKIKYFKSLATAENDNGVSFVRDCFKFENKSDTTQQMNCQVQGDFEISLYSGTMQKFIESYKADCNQDFCLTKITSQEDYILDGNKATKLTGTDAEGAQVLNYLFVTKNSKNYLISFNDHVREYLEMISSFKFL